MRRLLSLILFLLFAWIIQAEQLTDFDWAKDVGARKKPNTTTQFSILDYGATTDCMVKSTQAIQAAIDACTKAGGGKVVIPKGEYLCGSIYLKDNVNLEIAEGAILWGSTSIEDYPEIETRVAGIEMVWPSALINALKVKNVMVSGKGTVHAQGKVFWDYYWVLRKEYEPMGLRWIVDYDAKRPRTILVSDCEDVTIKGLTLKQAGFWTIQLLYSKYCTVDGVTILNNIDGHGPSTDGIDIDSSEKILVENCDIDCNDDNFCLKAGRDADGLRVNRPTQYVVIRNCLSRAGGGLFTCGSETSGGIRYVWAHNLKAKGTMTGIRLKSALTRGGTVEHIYINDIEMEKVGLAFEATNNWNPAYSYSTLPAEYDGKKIPDHWVKMLTRVEPAERGIPHFRHIYITNIDIKEAQSVIQVSGTSNSTMNDFYFQNVTVYAQKGGSVKEAKNWTVRDMKIITEDNEFIQVKNSIGVEFKMSETENSTFSPIEWPCVTKEMKPWTRWWWLGSSVDEAGLTSQLEAFAQAGIGGVEITPIYGVKGEEKKKIEFLSSKWMDMYSYTQQEAARLNMGVDLNNGTGWPFGGPNVKPEQGAAKAVFKNVGTDSVRVDVGRTGQKVKRAAPGGAGFVLNHLDSTVVKEYLKRFDQAFDSFKSLYPEHWFNDSYEVYGADWSENLLNEFEIHRGYRLQDHLNELLADGEDETSIRVISDYRETVSEMLLNNFTQVWTRWAHSHGSKTRNQAHGSPANLIDLYAAVDVPECETFGITDFSIPGLRKDTLRKENDGDPTTLKYASSAGHIAGHNLISSETFTWLTEHFRTSLSQCKPEIDQVFLSGVNHVYFHGAAYSPQEAKWPGWRFYASVDMTPNNTIWRDAPAFFNYITRAQSMLQAGKPDNDFLLYFPIYDIWAEQRGNHYLTLAIHGLRDKLPEFYKAVEQIRSCGYDLDYISDAYLMDATVEAGKIKTKGGVTYKALVLPAIKRIQPQLLTRIMGLASRGATIAFAEGYPTDVPGLANVDKRKRIVEEVLSTLPTYVNCSETKVLHYGKGRVIAGCQYVDLLAATEVIPERFILEQGGTCLRRAYENGYIYFMAMLENKSVDGWVALSVPATCVLIMNPMNGLVGKARTRKNDGVTEVYLQMRPGQSLFLKTYNEGNINVSEWNYYRPRGKPIEIVKGWKLRFVESVPEIKGSFSLPKLTSWTELKPNETKINRGTACYSVEFVLKDTIANEYLLDLGDVRESARISVNGKEVGTLFAVPFSTYIKPYLIRGKNRLDIEVTNLPANSIADYDRRGIIWRKFEEINVVNLSYTKASYGHWDVVPSGLLGPVTLTPCDFVE